jgi:hypothetical protein
MMNTGENDAKIKSSLLESSPFEVNMLEKIIRRGISVYYKKQFQPLFLTTGSGCATHFTAVFHPSGVLQRSVGKEVKRMLPIKGFRFLWGPTCLVIIFLAACGSPSKAVPHPAQFAYDGDLNGKSAIYIMNADSSG